VPLDDIIWITNGKGLVYVPYSKFFAADPRSVCAQQKCHGTGLFDHVPASLGSNNHTVIFQNHVHRIVCVGSLCEGSGGCLPNSKAGSYCD